MVARTPLSPDVTRNGTAARPRNTVQRWQAVIGKTARSLRMLNNCRAHDHHNLFILGSSVFATGSTANPTSTIAALSLRAVEPIKRQLRGGSAT